MNAEKNRPTPSPATDVDEVANKAAKECGEGIYGHRNGGVPVAAQLMLPIIKQSLLTYGEKLRGELDAFKKKCNGHDFDSVVSLWENAHIEMVKLQSANEELKKRLARDVFKMNMVQALDRAGEVVKNKLLFKRFIDGTPLENDIAVWMATFANEEVALAAIPTTVETVEREEWRQENEQLKAANESLRKENDILSERLAETIKVGLRQEALIVRKDSALMKISDGDAAVIHKTGCVCNQCIAKEALQLSLTISSSLVEDKELLDWAETKHLKIYRFIDGAKLTVWNDVEGKKEEYFIDTGNIRSAIRAARNSSKPTKTK